MIWIQEDCRKVSEKEYLEMLVLGVRREGASWASLDRAITRS